MSQSRALTANQVNAISKDGVHWVAPSLYMQVRDHGTRSWLFRYSRAGTNQWMGLGSTEEKPLSDARDEAAMLRVLVKRGEDPIANKRQVEAKRKIEMKPKVPTFAECAKQYIASHKSGWKNEKHAQQWPSTVEMYVNPFIGKMQVDQITVEDVLKALKPIWTSKAETASRVRGRIESILGWATAMGYRSGENPAQWKGGALPHLLPATGKISKVEHRKAVPYQDVPKLMAELRKNGSTSAKALMFTILTGARTTETREATHTEIDHKAKVWTIPAGRMKAGREHRVPLTDDALALIDGDTAESKYLFPSPSGYALSNMAMLQLLRGLRDDGSTVHGFRSSFRDWAAEQTDFPREVVEACLAHALGDDAELAYKRQGLIETWHDRRIAAGDNFGAEIDRHLEEAEIILLLVSPDFLASEYCYDREMGRAIQRDREGSARVIPVILRPCDWTEGTPFKKLLAAPTDGKPVTQWPDRDLAFLDVTRMVKAALVKMGSKPDMSLTRREPPRPEFSETHKLVPERSSNLRLKKEFSERDKDRFKHDAFEFIAKFFEGSLAELGRRNEGVEGDFRKVDANRFTAAIYRNGMAEARCTVFMGSIVGGGGISFVWGETDESNSMNESLSVKSDDQMLFLQPLGMQRIGSSREAKLSYEGAAEFFWSLLIERLQ